MLTGFLVSGAVLTPILGKLGDQFGKERLLLIALGLFLAGCLGAACAWNIWSLIGSPGYPADPVATRAKAKAAAGGTLDADDTDAISIFDSSVHVVPSIRES